METTDIIGLSVTLTGLTGIIIGLNYYALRIILPLGDMVEISIKSNPGDLKAKAKCLYDIANTVDVHDLFSKEYIGELGAVINNKYPSLGLEHMIQEGNISFIQKLF